MKITALLFMILISANSVSAKIWRSIVPLLSTRADVNRLLGVPTKTAVHGDYYEFSNEIALIWYQTGPCDEDLGRFGYGWRVSNETVTEIGIIPKRISRKEDFGVKSFPEVEDVNSGFVYYSNNGEGLAVETLHGVVTSVTFFPTEKEDVLRCAMIEKCCVDFFPTFDEYQNLSWEDEKARLDNFVINMNERLNRGVIVVFGQNPGERRRLMKRASNAKNYLLRRRSVEPKRILVADGGYSERAFLRLSLYSIGGPIWRVYLFPQLDPPWKREDKKC